MCILLKSPNSKQFIQCFIEEIPDQSAEDMHQLIEGANVQMSEMAESENDLGNSFFYDGTPGNLKPEYEQSFAQSFKAEMLQEVADGEKRRRELDIRMIMMEEEAQNQQAVIDERDKMVHKLQM